MFREDGVLKKGKVLWLSPETAMIRSQRIDELSKLRALLPVRYIVDVAGKRFEAIARARVFRATGGDERLLPLVQMDSRRRFWQVSRTGVEIGLAVKPPCPVL